MKRKPKIVIHSNVFEIEQANVMSIDNDVKSAQYISIPKHLEEIKFQYNDLTTSVYDPEGGMRIYLEEKQDSYAVAIIDSEDFVIQDFEFSDQNKEIQIDLYYRSESTTEMIMVVSKNE